jgi:hypothetical protein
MNVVQMLANESASPRSSLKRAQFMRGVLPAAGGVAVVVAGCVIWAISNFGTVNHALLYVRGARVLVEPDIVTVTDGNSGEFRAATFFAHNLTEKPVTILDATVSCGCVSTTDRLPVVVPPKPATELHVTLALPIPSMGAAVQKVLYRTDHPSAPGITATVWVKSTKR